MKIKNLLNIIFLFFFTSCFAQNDRIENKMMDCIYQSYDDSGKKLKKLIYEYQSLLINEGILSDNNGKSYLQILQKIANKNEFDKEPSKSFTTELRKIEKPNLEKVQKCKNIIVKDSALYNISKLKDLEQVIIHAQNSYDLQPSLIAKDILKILSEQDFEIDFYKLRVFNLLTIIDTNSRISRELPEYKKDETEYGLNKVFIIYLDKINQIFVNNEKVSIVQLKKLIQEYELKNKSESIILFKKERETTYKTYLDVQNAIVGEIQNLREQLAKEKYKMELDKLTEKQLIEIKKIYPQKIVEQ